MALASVVDFCVSQKEILEIGGGEGLPLYLLHLLTLPLSKKDNHKISRFLNFGGWQLWIYRQIYTQ